MLIDCGYISNQDRISNQLVNSNQNHSFNSPCNVTWRIVLHNDVTAIVENCCHENVYRVFSDTWKEAKNSFWYEE